MKTPIAQFLLLSALLVLTTQQSIQTLNGKWTVEYCSAILKCGWKIAYNMQIVVDEASSSLTKTETFIDAIANQYTTIESHYDYSSLQGPDEFQLVNKNEASDTLNLKIVDQNSTYFYNIHQNSEHFDGGNTKMWGLMRENAQFSLNLYDAIQEKFPNIQMDSPIEDFDTQYPPVSAFNHEILFGKRWYLTSEFYYAQNDRVYQSFTQDNVCNFNLFTTNYTNNLTGYDSPYNIQKMFTTSSPQGYDTEFIFLYYPDPQTPGKIFGFTRSFVIIYATDNLIIEIDLANWKVNMLQTVPSYSLASLGIFHAQLVRVGINPLNGQRYDYNNTWCQPTPFNISSLISNDLDSWVMTEIYDDFPETAASSKTLACTQIDIRFGNEEKSVLTFLFDGYNLTSGERVLKMVNATQDKEDQRKLYFEGEDIPYIVTQIDPYSFIFNKSDVIDNKPVHRAFVIVRNFDQLNLIQDQFILRSYYDNDEVQLLPFTAGQCDPYGNPVSNINEAIIDDNWYMLESYIFANTFETHFNCWKISIQNSTEYPNYLHIKGLGYTDYQPIIFDSLNAQHPDVKGYFIPMMKLFNANGWPGFNRAELFMSVLHFTETEIIFVQDIFMKDLNVYFLAKDKELTPERKAVFEQIVQQYFKQFKSESLFVVDNDKCNW